ncbi:MAG: Aspartate ammonia-lyase (EC [uncultured Campylobacterales bacterium]|uniref:Aspartate ammonia-lyase (EC) n=1 Tax=uncultured Campylobacterales bacterium TaxID=352960 RepID=A0A6S6STZ3_9BACT|nr:MAG: Aspartate ammonia-lyase (EC [uncultured Campylobacterales bacterium]
MRIESDLLGERELEDNVYYGIQSLRGFENFPITGYKTNKNMIKSLALTKKASAICNNKIKKLDDDVANAISQACDELLDDKLLDQFIVDPIQGGAGTSLNMNINEVLANRGNEILGGKLGSYDRVHPNDHVNYAQSTNDVIPTAGKICALYMSKELLEVLTDLISSFENKAKEFHDVIKMGRTQLQDAVPMRLSQEFNAYVKVLKRDYKRIDEASKALRYISLGATAIGTSINADTEYVDEVVSILAELTSLDLTQNDDLVDGTQNLDCFTYFSSILKTFAINLSKISNDLRLMSSGPRTGLGEINLPEKQPGSSIMPGKVNPVIPEVVNQVAFLVAGNDVTISMAVEAGQLELNAFEPIIFYKTFQSIKTLRNVMKTFKTNCIDGITANKEVCASHVENSIGIITAIVPHIGYKKSSYVARKALRENKNLKEILLEEGIMSKEEIENILDIEKMV